MNILDIVLLIGAVMIVFIIIGLAYRSHCMGDSACTDDCNQGRNCTCCNNHEAK